MYTIIETAKLNGINPEAYLADIIGRIGDHPANQIDDLLPWRWKPPHSGNQTKEAAVVS